MAEKIWVVAADSSRARIFQTTGSRKPLEEIEVLAHPESRLHEGDLSDDGPGMVHESHGDGRHLTDNYRKQYEAEVFAREVCKRLHEARAGGSFDRLYLLASPAFLGHLRDGMDAPTRKLIQAEVDKNVVLAKPEQIRDHLPWTL